MPIAQIDTETVIRSLGDHSFVFYGLVFFGIILARYFLLAGGSWWWLYARSPATSSGSTQRLKHNDSNGIGADISLSVLSAAVFALATVTVLALQSHGLTRLYARPDTYGWWYLAFSYGAVLILQDGIYYATHRLIHHRWLYPWCHHGHHRTRQPTPWTSFAFDPPEAILQALVLVLLVMLVPLHLITLMAVLSTMTIWAIVNHLGLDRLPSGFPHHWLGRWVIGPAHHSLHHRHPGVHFGLYFTLWDRIGGTEDSSYDAAMEPSNDLSAIH
ncbi:sterol desaturase family protein [Synechococcus sp. Cruz-9H2]|uniref:sterol desaturase family protein n=1 Tax=unclassified Synechococcus TaxID=2626047 RepID=UPI0020CE983F|nr:MULTISPECIES: sterol desaturase family protein [unclassified Synechococcus]MCP9820843.1 sterol desaturase family protein [Synechococcus sp. Cruz-9H2]MCP9845085.1 sterol desaturase family protein [Synechococcus sp. Edmonson 11F2]MCP9857199.1 sterol desaturase family protein [Synechococcus sp. Cruz-9C9]MCP9864484.1 sterol desaturase family protein [Synechococcus sp. Cruz-7E5]MCP9871753.1 sterol desaturase family protein [Synechococcus sp. Cruz-7B9]